MKVVFRVVLCCIFATDYYIKQQFDKSNGKMGEKQEKSEWWGKCNG